MVDSSYHAITSSYLFPKLWFLCERSRKVLLLFKIRQRSLFEVYVFSKNVSLTSRILTCLSMFVIFTLEDYGYVILRFEWRSQISEKQLTNKKKNKMQPMRWSQKSQMICSRPLRIHLHLSMCRRCFLIFWCIEWSKIDSHDLFDGSSVVYNVNMICFLVWWHLCCLLTDGFVMQKLLVW